VNKAMNPGGPFGARWLGLNAPNGDYGIHGTNNPSSIGKDISNGCIRIYNNNVIELYNLVQIGTRLKLYKVNFLIMSLTSSAKLILLQVVNSLS
jgi:lipoprotein-anchoring transpeptidase ErfK/SrfK